MTLSPRWVGKNEAIAGRSMPGNVFRTNFAIAIKAPVLPAETTPSARPSATASIASRMLDCRPVRSAIDGLSSSITISLVWRSSTASARRGSFASRGLRIFLVTEKDQAQPRVPLQCHISAAQHHIGGLGTAHRVEGDR